MSAIAKDELDLIEQAVKDSTAPAEFLAALNRRHNCFGFKESGHILLA